MLPLSLYIHIPWCVRKCPYCDFNSHPQRGDLPETEYLQVLLSDLEQLLPKVWGRPVSSIYFGGGTPSLFSADAIERILMGVRSRLMLVPECEITLEANPGTVEHDRFEAYRDVGVNRVSLGVQSFDDQLLKRLGRIHDGRHARQAIEALLAAGFDNFNVDLMHGLPDQDQQLALSDISIAMAYRPPHLSHYQLTIEPNTAFAVTPPRLPDDDTLDVIQSACHESLIENGWRQYEVSAWSLTGCESRHNMNYWQYGDYLGIGAGAHGKITDLASRQIWRYARVRHPKQYLAAPQNQRWNSEESTLAADDLIFEFFFNGLRLREGVRLTHFNERTGMSLEQVRPKLDKALTQGLVELSDDRLHATELGWRFMNDLQAIFLPDR